MSIKNFTKKLLVWYDLNKRDLPWRNSINPYIIWVSEIILQQTRIEQGLPYFKKFINKYPNVFELSKANLDELMNVWQGLGYYSRAVNMYKSSKIIVQEFSGDFPVSYESLVKLPGIGDYTASAISSICNNECKIVVDGNVMRLFSRLFNLKKEVNSIGLKNQIKFIGDKLISKSKPGNFNQALMDFGSMICSPKNYKCGNCIFSKDCIAFKNNTIDFLPLKKAKVKIKTRYLNYLIGLSNNDKVKIIKRNKKDIWQGLYEFPLIETNHEIDLSQTEKKFEKIGYFKAENVIKKLTINHKLTHQNLHIYFWIFKTYFEDNNCIKINDLESYPFPKPLFEIISQIK